VGTETPYAQGKDRPPPWAVAGGAQLGFEPRGAAARSLWTRSGAARAPPAGAGASFPASRTARGHPGGGGVGGPPPTSAERQVGGWLTL
jgi:hypothetical protein